MRDKARLRKLLSMVLQLSANHEVSMNIPDIIGYTLEEARAILDKENILIDCVKVTAPPKQKTDEYQEHFRVIRWNRIEQQKVELLVCRPE